MITVSDGILYACRHEVNMRTIIMAWEKFYMNIYKPASELYIVVNL